MRCRVWAGLLAVALAGGTAHAQAEGAAAIGLYRAAAGPDTASMLEIAADGRFRYQLSEGALDEQAQGRWRATTGGVLLDTTPHPKPPEFALGAIGTAREAPFSVIVTGPDGQGIAGVDFRIGFATGEPITGYTQDYGWTPPGDEARQPLWIEFAEPVHGFASPRFALPDRKAMAISATIIANDLGVADFRDAPAMLTDDGLVLHWRGGELPFRRVDKRSDGSDDE